MPEFLSASENERDIPSAELGTWKTSVLLVSVMVVAMCGITYELIVATVSSYLLGNSVYQFSITIGLFMFAMGVGSYLSRHLDHHLVSCFVTVEIAVALVGGVSSTVLFVVFPFYAFYRPVMYTLIISIGALVGLEIPILTRLLSQARSLRLAIANVLSLDYLGALIGSVGFPILLLPSLGLFRASYVIGLLNAIVAIVTVYCFRHALRRPGVYFLGCFFVITTLLAGLIYSASVTTFAEGQLFADQIIHREQTPYQRIIVTRNDRNAEIRLYLDGHLQFASGDEYRYHEALVHPVMALKGDRIRILLLGGGDGMAAREILKYDDVAKIDLVDIDPTMTRLCSTFPPISRLNEQSLTDPRITIHHEDAFNFVRNASHRYDRVIIDLPDPHNEVLNKLYSVEFYKGVRRLLSDGGFVATQASSPFYTREAYWCIARTMQAAELKDLGPMHTYSFCVTVPSFGIWGFHLAAQDGKMPDRFPVDISKTKFLSPQVMAIATQQGKDLAPIEVPVNSMFEPKLYPLYLQGVLR